MRTNDKDRTVFLDPRYSVLGLSRRLGRHGLLYLDLATGWQGSPRTSPALEQRPRRDPPK